MTNAEPATAARTVRRLIGVVTGGLVLGGACVVSSCLVTQSLNSTAGLSSAKPLTILAAALVALSAVALNRRRPHLAGVAGVVLLVAVVFGQLAWNLRYTQLDLYTYDVTAICSYASRQAFTVGLLVPLLAPWPWRRELRRTEHAQRSVPDPAQR